MNPRLSGSVLVLLLLLAGGTVACGGAPAQIVDYAPLRGAQDVPTVAPVQITFDHAVDQRSVATRLHLVPAVDGSVSWLGPRQVVFDHARLDPATSYEVVLEAGYRDTSGNEYVLRHHWSFVTEPAPGMSTSSPADGSQGIDPAAYLTVDFTHPMDPASLRSAITFTPAVRFGLRLDPADARRAIVAPDALLQPATAYTMLVTNGALDADGNELDGVRTIHFSTGPVVPLHGWVAFATQSISIASGGLWIVNESGFPRKVLDVTSLSAYSWSPEGDRVVYEGDSGRWATFAPGNDSLDLGFSASWAAALASGLGYVYLDPVGALHRQLVGGSDIVIASGVSDATVSPDGRRVAYVQAQDLGVFVIWGYDVGLRSHYVLGSEASAVQGLAWAPAGNRLAYLRIDPKATVMRVRSFSGSAATTTIATGDLGTPSWLPDSVHILFAATVNSAVGPVRKAFLVNITAPPTALTSGTGLPSDPSVDVANPTPSPDGHQIAFISGNQVWLMNADGTRPTPLTRYDAGSFPYSCLMPAWTRA